MTKTLSRRLERLETRLTPTDAPFEIDIVFVSAVDGSITKRLHLGGGATSNGHGGVGVSAPTLPGRVAHRE
jgi:hypothetical protein